MKPIFSEHPFDQDQMAQVIAGEIGTRWLQETIREELGLCDVVIGFPSLTVAVCTRDRPDCLTNCLRSLVALRNNGDPVDSNWDIVVVDNAPSDQRTRHAVTQFSDVRYISEIRPGLNFARNRALRESQSELLAFVDDDVVVDPGWLRGLAKAYSENPDAAAFTGQVLPLVLQTEAQILFEQRGGFRRGFESVRYVRNWPSGDDGFLYPCRSGIFGVGCNMAFRRQALLELGGFDEALDTGQPLPGGGDHDIFYRIIRADHALIYEPELLVFHQHRHTMELLRRQYWSWGLSVMAHASKTWRADRTLRTRWWKLILFWFENQVREFVQALVGNHVLPARFVFWELCGGIKGLCGEYKRSVKRVERIRKQYR